MTKQALVSLALVGTLALALPFGLAPAPARANGAASTRNLLILGAAAATYLIVQHNRKVHEKYAEDAARQAQLQEQRNDAWAAYHQEQRAYEQEHVAVSELKKEVAYQHNTVEQLRKQVADVNQHGFAQQEDASGGQGRQVALVSYGWGQI
jgi:uncharacterized protein HemX